MQLFTWCQTLNSEFILNYYSSSFSIIFFAQKMKQVAIENVTRAEILRILITLPQKRIIMKQKCSTVRTWVMFRSILSHIISYLFNFVLSSATSCARSTSARWWRRLVYLGQSSASTRRFTRHSCNRTTFLTKDDFKESHNTPVTFVVRSGLTARSLGLISVSCMRAKNARAKFGKEVGEGRTTNKFVYFITRRN